MVRVGTLVLAILALPVISGADPALDTEEIEFLRLINEYRAANGAPCLSPSPTMNEAADYMSRVMGEQEFFSHNEPPCDEAGSDCSGRDPFRRIQAFGHVGWSLAGENIAAGMPTAAEAFEAWRNSPGHDANMRERGFTAIGIARVFVQGSPWRVYWTTDFSDLVDGPWGCEPPFDDPTGGTGGAGGKGGAGGSGGAGGQGGIGGAGGSGGFAGSGGVEAPGAGGKQLPWDEPDDRSGSGGCSQAGAPAGIFGMLVALCALRRRR